MLHPTTAAPTTASPTQTLPLAPAASPLAALARLGHWVGQLPHRRTITVSVEDGLARIVVLRRRQVLAWWTTDLGGASSEGEQRLNAVGPPPWGLQLPAGRVVTDLPLTMPMLRPLRLTKVGRRYLEQVVLSEVTESVPFPVEEVDVGWRAHTSGKDRDVFAVALPKQALASHVQLLRQAGLRPVAAYAKAAALCLAAGVPDAVLVHLGKSQAAIALVRGQAPQAVHQVELPGEVSDPQDLADLVAREVELVAAYHRPVDPAEGAPIPVVLTGQVKEHANLVEALPPVLERPVLPFAPPCAHPDGFDPEAYAINLGLALADSARGSRDTRASRTAVAALNLLPERYLPRPLPVRPIAVFAALALFSAAALNIQGWVDRVATRAAAAAAQLTALQGRERQQRLVSIRITGLDKQAKAGAHTASALELRLAQFGEETLALQERMQTLATRAPGPGLQLSTLSMQGDSFVLTGAAAGYDDVLRYAKELRASGLFSEVKIGRMERPNSQAIEPGQVAGRLPVDFQMKAQR